MMQYNELDARTIRERIDMAQLWSAWIEADDLRRHSFRGYIRWEDRNGRDYLYSRKRGVVKSLGPRSPETEQTYAAFHQGREANESRLSSLSVEMDRQAAVLSSLNAGRLPLMAARTLRALRTHDKAATILGLGYPGGPSVDRLARDVLAPGLRTVVRVVPRGSPESAG